MAPSARRLNPDDTPDGWWFGLAMTLAVGITVSAYVGALVYNLAYALYNGSAEEAMSSVPRALLGMILSWPVALVIGIIPITISYAALRLAAPYFEMTVRRRVAIGLALGAAVNVSWLALSPPYDHYTGQIGLSALKMPFFPYLEIQASALALALVVRSQWFGIIDPRRS